KEKGRRNVLVTLSGFIPETLRTNLAILVLFSVCVLFMITLSRIGPPRLAGPLEQTRNEQELAHLLKSWQQNGVSGRDRATRNFPVDYFFIPTYVATIGIACLVLSKRFTAAPLPTVFFATAWTTYLLAAADVTENTLLLWVLHKGYRPGFIAAASIATRLKFGILSLDLLVVVPGVIGL